MPGQVEDKAKIYQAALTEFLEHHPHIKNPGQNETRRGWALGIAVCDWSLSKKGVVLRGLSAKALDRKKQEFRLTFGISPLEGAAFGEEVLSHKKEEIDKRKTALRGKNSGNVYHASREWGRGPKFTS